jgi:sugar O-acyltransferase (sialic acid O-acetyltransferase NeuD family)
MKLYGVYGSGGFGREVMPLMVANVDNSPAKSADTRVVFVDDRSAISDVNGYPVLSFDEFCDCDSDSKQIAIAIAGSNAREVIYRRMIDRGISCYSIRALNCVQLQDSQIGDGAILCPFSSITSNVKVGTCFHLNLYSYVAHDCVIGDFVTFAPGVKCNGNVVIEDQVYVGTGAIIKQGKPGRPLLIGKGAKIEAGSYVTRDVAPGSSVFGNPAIKISLSNLRKLKSVD